jgi:acyl carrier protein
MTVRQLVVSHIDRVAKEQRLTLAPLTDDLVLLESGLDSLGFAILAARLEDELGVDPFAASETVSFPVTLGDFVQTYENARK